MHSQLSLAGVIYHVRFSKIKVLTKQFLILVEVKVFRLTMCLSFKSNGVTTYFRTLKKKTTPHPLNLVSTFKLLLSVSFNNTTHGSK